MKKLNQKPKFVKRISTLTMAVSGLMLANSTTASDLEIYSGASGGGAVISMIFDNSASMNADNSIAVDYPNVQFSNRGTGVYNNVTRRTTYKGIEEKKSVQVQPDTPNTAGRNLEYTVFYFQGTDGKRYYDRLSRLKMAVIPIFADPRASIGENYQNYKIGMGSFFRDAAGATVNGNNGGKIDTPALPMNFDNRVKLLQAIIALEPSTGTPIAHAYAEAAAYMLGTTTTGGGNGTYDAQSGFSKRGREVPTSNGNYVSPITSTNAQCSGNGIYFLTDGEPNLVLSEPNVRYILDSSRRIQYQFPSNISSQYRYAVVEKSHSTSGELIYPLKQNNQYYTSAHYFNARLLSPKPYGVLQDNTDITMPYRNTLNSSITRRSFVYPEGRRYIFFQPSSLDVGQGWEDVGYLAKHLYDKDRNPKGVQIKTATVGFGRDFIAAKGIADNCDVITTGYAKNLCLWGSKNSNYGQGGFTYAEEENDIKQSLVTFIQEQGATEIQPISTGTMSVPLDAVNAQSARGFAYLPALDPRPGSNDLWNGNLKKYYTYRGGVVDGSMTFSGTGTVNRAGRPVFTNDNTGEFRKDTYDIWNTLRTTDNAQVQVGGAFMNIFANSNVQPSGQNTRNLYVNTGNTLTSVSINPQNRRPVGFTAVQNQLNLSDKNAPMSNLLSFLGYPAQAGTLNDNTTITGAFNKDLQKLGGVLHSLPQVVTYEISLDDEGEFDPNTRKDGMLYGSMEGVLHLLDDKTGKELFSFIPKEILELQSKALAGGSANGTTGRMFKSGTNYEEHNYPHGVDAPWNVYNNYALTKSNNKTQYKALQTFASGGLRMGGSSYYSLDISNSTAPRHIYSLGSNYAHYLQGTTNTIQGMRNGALGTSDEQNAYARMGQSWGKPAIGFVKSNGKKVMVHFLPGGYDVCYEKPTFKLNSSDTDSKCSNKATAQGNAVYMVQVAEETTNPTSQVVTMKTDANSGKLLWWATNGTGTSGNTQRTSSLQQSLHQDLKHSIVNEIRTVDRNYDGLTDHIYFADLGGQVWRADINQTASTLDATKTDNFKIDRVVKILDVADQASASEAPPRFYERPLFTVTNEVDASGGLSGVITVGTGNRSNPVSEKRTKADSIYTIVDKDVGRRDLFCYDKDATKCPTITLNTQNIKVSNLEELKFQASDANIKTNMRNSTKQGWYFPLTTWATKDRAGATQISQASGLKMFNEPDAQARLLFVTTYNPNTSTAANSCSAGIIGETQRTLMCLPFGNCANTYPNNQFTNRSFSTAGIGIVDNILTQSSPWENTDKGKLFGTLCTAGNCEKEEPTPNINLDIDKVGVNLTRVINPRDWWEK